MIAGRRAIGPPPPIPYTESASGPMSRFQPLFRNPHFQTIAGHYWKRPAPDHRYPVERRLYQTEPGVQVLVESQRPLETTRGEVIMLHGLEGSAKAVYIASLSGVLLDAGFAAHRFNMRTCGGTEHLSDTLYHGGLTSDLLAVVRQLKSEGRGPIYLIGFSLGGNVVVKLAGELGDSGPDHIRAVCAVSAPLDLGRCARRVMERDNMVYDWRFVRRMRQRLLATGKYKAETLSRLTSVMAIDDHITAPAFGFGDAQNYYRTQSAIGYLPGLRVPVLLIYSKDDTLVPNQTFDAPEVAGNPWIRRIATEHGGHLGFIGKQPHRFWLDTTIRDWLVG